MIAHGHSRNTFDIDLIIRRGDLKDWVELLTSRGYTLINEGVTFSQFNPADDKMLPVDLMTVNDETFSKLFADAVPGPAQIEHVKLVSLLHLLALKCHAIKHGHSGRIIKDTDDVIRLIQINRLDVKRADLREIFQKFGTEELYEKVKKACASD